MLLVVEPAQAARVTVGFRISLEQPNAAYASCAVSVPAKANAVTVLRAAARSQNCDLLDYQLDYDSTTGRHYVVCVNYLCDGAVYASFWHQGNDLAMPPAWTDSKGASIEGFHARNGAVLTYTYYTRPCVFTIGSYACV
jgi:hypothetical protein